MTTSRALRALALTAALSLALPGAATAAEPETLPQKTFDVQVEGGVAVVTFALALSEVRTYPVKVTAIGGAREEVLWEGMLEEGWYRLRGTLDKITAGPLKVVLRTKVTNRTAQGYESFIRYLVWEGTVN